MKAFFVGNGKMIQEISKISDISCVGVYDKDLYILLEKPDIIIDFSHPDFYQVSAKKALEFNAPLLVGTTGYDIQQMAYLKENSKHIPILFSPNFSQGIILIKNFLEGNKSIINSYESKIVETHNLNKADKPSGTAIYLADSFNFCPIFSYRLKDINGIHEIVLTNENEIITIRHEALSKKVFSLGVYDAAKRLLKKGPGFYRYEDLLDEENDYQMLFEK
jgi:4-hydroxy-tetrahydrodipicolinate reductase